MKKLSKELLSQMDVWIANYQDETPTAEECTVVEEAKIVELTTEYDTVAGTLWRVKEEVPKEREQFVKYLGWKRGKLFLKFGATIQALKDQAIETLTHCDEMWKTFEAELIESFPVPEPTIGQELQEFLTGTTNYVNDTFPEGVEGLDAFDDALPDGVPSYTEFQRTVLASENKLKTVNKEAIPGEIAKIKETGKVGLKLAVNEAIQKAVADFIMDFSDESLPYLNEEENAALRKELAAAVKDYGASRMDT